MTDTQPEALRLAQELDAVPETGADPQTIQDTAAELRRLHAYCQELESHLILDCMTHVQNPAENEHVAGDVSKNGAELNMTCASHGQAPAAVAGCTRSHPHENMDSSCRAKTAIAEMRSKAVRGAEATAQDLERFVRMLAAAPSPTAQADSVQEDAARLDFLIKQRAYVVSDPDACPGYWLHFIHKETGKCWAQGDEHPTPRAAIDAARKEMS